MDYRSMSLFKKTISQYLQGCAEIVNVTTADIAVFDMDSPHSKDQWNAFKFLFPNVATIALSTAALNLDDITCMRKPIDFSLLTKIINKLVPDKKLVWTIPESSDNEEEVNSSRSARLSKKELAQEIDDSISNKDAIKPANYNLSNIESASNLFDPRTFLYSTLKEVVKESKALGKYRKVVLWNQKFLIIDPVKNVIVTDMSNGVLRSVCLTATNTDQTPVEVVVTNEKWIEQDTAKSKTTVYKIDTLLWLMAILSSRGRIPTSLDGFSFDPECPVYLLHWPNLTRLEPIPHSQSIVSLWIKQPRSLSSLASTLNIDIKHVYNLFVAAQAIGIAGQARRPGDKLFTPTIAVQHKQRGLFASIVKKLNSLSNGKASIAISR